MKGKFIEEIENREDFVEDGLRVLGVIMEGYKRVGEWVIIKLGDLLSMSFGFLRWGMIWEF